MNLNIAFNTIIYIMVFLFPGIIFRKFFFRGKFKNQFEHGNVLERLLWNILTSVFCIITFGIIIYYSTVHLEHKLFDTLEYTDVYNLFNDLSKNTFPTKLEKFDGLKSFVLVFASLYAYSAVIGYFSFFIVTRLKLDKRFSFFRFNNHWEYFANVNSSTFKHLKLFRNYATYVDILISNKDSKDLYRGRLHEIIYDKDNKIEHIALKDALIFNQIILDDESKIVDGDTEITVNGRPISKINIHTHRPDKLVFKKFIDGHIFVIPNNNIDNLNFTYVQISDGINVKRVSEILLAVFIIIGLAGIITIISNLFFNFIFPFYLDTLFKRILFSFASCTGIILLLDVNSTKLKSPIKDKNTYYHLYQLLFISSIYLYLFNILTGWEYIILFALSSFFNLSNKSKYAVNFWLYALVLLLYYLLIHYFFR